MVDRRAARVLAGKFDVVRVVAGAPDGLDAHLEDPVEVLAQLVPHVNVGRGDEGVDAEPLGRLERLGTGVDVARHGAGEAAGHRTLENGSDAAHALEVGKARLDHVDPELLEGECDLHLLACGEALRQGLLAVAERGVEKDDALGIRVDHEVGSLSLCVELGSKPRTTSSQCASQRAARQLYVFAKPTSIAKSAKITWLLPIR